MLRRAAKAVSKAASRVPRLCSTAAGDVVADSEAPQMDAGGGALDAGGGALGAGGDASGATDGPRRGTRVRRPPGSTPEFVGVMSCNECMDVETGLRTDGGTTCVRCFDAVYLDGGCRGKHATIGGEPFPECIRKQQTRKDSKTVTSLKQKLEKLRRQRAVGNRE